MIERGVGLFFPDRFLDGEARSIAVRVARDSVDRARGLLDVDESWFTGDAGLVLDLERPTRASITTSGLAAPIDVVFVDDRGLVLDLIRDARPNSGVYRSSGLARWVVELPAGAARRIGITHRSSFALVRER